MSAQPQMGGSVQMNAALSMGFVTPMARGGSYSAQPQRIAGGGAMVSAVPMGGSFASRPMVSAVPMGGSFLRCGAA